MTWLFIKFLSSRDGLLEMDVSSNSQMAASARKAYNMTNGSGGSKEAQKANLVDLISQKHYCDLCRKCITEKKKLVAHRKICLLKFNKKNEKQTVKSNGVLK